jgi:hypothetical protein
MLLAVECFLHTIRVNCLAIVPTSGKFKPSAPEREIAVCSELLEHEVGSK